jgi:ArsR family metal-binding transcriptional regulator
VTARDVSGFALDTSTSPGGRRGAGRTDTLTTFTDRQEFERAAALLDKLRIDHALISPEPAYARVGCPAIALAEEGKALFLKGGGCDIVSAGWVSYRPPSQPVPERPARDFAEDVVGRVALVVLAACVADPERLRLTAHLSGDVGEALPYLNAELPQGSYVARLPVFTFMDGHRMVSLFRDRVGMAKADDIVDAWASLERLRCLVNDVWSRRETITPSFELRRRPPALEIYKRLPGTNCKACGEPTCMAFAWAVWRGEVEARFCRPVFDGDRGDLRDALLSICSGLGLGARSLGE